MFQLFKKVFNWQGVVAEEALEAYFRDTFVRTKKETYVDLIFTENNQLVGFNMAEVQRMQIAGQIFWVVRSTLAVCVPALESCKRLMSLISSQRGFILQKENPHCRVISCFEAASVFSYLQVRDLDVFPVVLQDLTDVVRRFYASEIIEGDEPPFYIEDELAKPPEPINKPWLSHADLAVKFFGAFFAQPRKSPIFAFEHTQKNLDIIAEIIDPHLDGLDKKDVSKFKNIVNTNDSHVGMRAKL